MKLIYDGTGDYVLHLKLRELYNEMFKTFTYVSLQQIEDKIEYAINTYPLIHIIKSDISKRLK